MAANLNDGLTPTERQALEEELARRRRNLAALQAQQAKYGIDVPVRLINEIADEETRIAQIEARLSGAEGRPSLAAQYFSRATQALVMGDLWEARRYYEMALDEDPFYPRAQEQLTLVQRQIATAAPPAAAPPRGCLAGLRNILGFGCVTLVVLAILILIGGR